MPELRRDPIVERWVIIAENRGDRPGEFVVERGENLSRDGEAAKRNSGLDKACPFCPGNEAETPAEIFAIRDNGTPPNTPGWRVRVVPNKYPALVGKIGKRPGRDIDPAGQSSVSSLFNSAPAAGVHEVIIDTPRHVTRMAELTDEECTASLAAIRAHLLALRDESNLAYALVFKNVGRGAGTARALAQPVDGRRTDPAAG